MGVWRVFGRLLSGLLIGVVAVGVVWAADPGAPLPADGGAGFQKPGSILIYPFYGSSLLGQARENTRLTMTNTSESVGVFIRLFFIQGSSGSARELVICLVQNETVSLTASDFDPGVRGYLLAVAIDERGCPVSFNYLMGEASVKFESGRRAMLPAESIAAIDPVPVDCNGLAPSATILFDGVHYDRLASRVAVDKLRNRREAGSLVLILSRIGGDIFGGQIGPLQQISAELVDDRAAGRVFAIGAASPQLVIDVSTVVSANAGEVFPAGRSGWMSLASPSGLAFVGASLSGTGSNPAFSQSSHRLRRLRLAPVISLRVPAGLPLCYSG